MAKVRLMLECSRCGKGELIEVALTEDGEVPKRVKCDACKALELVEFGARRAARHAVRAEGNALPDAPPPLESLSPREMPIPAAREPLLRRLRLSR